MARRITAVTLIILAGCKGGSGWMGTKPKNTLSYSQYHSLEQGMRAKAVLKAFGDPVHTLEQDGKVRGLTYFCENATGQVMQLRMVFSAEEQLHQWALKSPEGKKAKSDPPASAG
ncbi:MAG: hypothetical protein ACYTG3_05885 [Planctomycetota bacterium]|jgi:hypothetical protein